MTTKTYWMTRNFQVITRVKLDYVPTLTARSNNNNNRKSKSIPIKCQPFHHANLRWGLVSSLVTLPLAPPSAPYNSSREQSRGTSICSIYTNFPPGSFQPPNCLLSWDIKSNFHPSLFSTRCNTTQGEWWPPKWWNTTGGKCKSPIESLVYTFLHRSKKASSPTLRCHRGHVYFDESMRDFVKCDSAAASGAPHSI